MLISPSAGSSPIGVSTASAVPSQRRKTHSRTRLFSPKPGQRNLPSSSLRNQLTKKIRGSSAPSRSPTFEPVGEVVGHVVAAEGQHRHRVEAELRRPRRPRRRSSRGHRRAEEDAVLPVEGLLDQRHHGRAATAEEEGVDRHAGRVLPLVGDRRALRGRGREAGVRVGRRARRTRASSRCRASRSRASGGSPVIPSHQMSPSSVLAQLVKIELRSIVFIAFGLVAGRCPGATPKKPASGLTAQRRPSSSNFIQAMSSPIVSTFQSGQGRDQHRQVGLAGGRREGAGDVLDLALGRGQLEDQHVLGEPALVAGHRRGDPQREALLAEQGVAAVARAEGPDLARLRVVDDVLVVRVAGPGHVLDARRPAASRPSARRGRSRRRRRAPRAPPRPSGS